MMPRQRIQIAIANRQRELKLDRAALRSAIRCVLIGEGVADAEISLAVVDDEEMADLNSRFLRHAGPTDVLTFPLSEPGEGPLSAEIVVSAKRAQREAKRRRLSPLDELRLYVIHGALHLCGYDDHTSAGRRRMRARERHWVKTRGRV